MSQRTWTKKEIEEEIWLDEQLTKKWNEKFPPMFLPGGGTAYVWNNTIVSRNEPGANPVEYLCGDRAIFLAIPKHHPLFGVRDLDMFPGVVGGGICLSHKNFVTGKIEPNTWFIGMSFEDNGYGLLDGGIAIQRMALWSEAVRESNDVNVDYDPTRDTRVAHLNERIQELEEITADTTELEEKIEELEEITDHLNEDNKALRNGNKYQTLLEENRRLKEQLKAVHSNENQTLQEENRQLKEQLEAVKFIVNSAQ